MHTNNRAKQDYLPKTFAMHAVKSLTWPLREEFATSSKAKTKHNK